MRRLAFAAHLAVLVVGLLFSLGAQAAAGGFGSQALALAQCQKDEALGNVAPSVITQGCTLGTTADGKNSYYTYSYWRNPPSVRADYWWNGPVEPPTPPETCIPPRVLDSNNQCIDPPKPDLCKASSPFTGWIDFRGHTPGVMCKEGCAYYAGEGNAGAKEEDGSEFRFVGTFEPLGRQCEAGEGSGTGEPGIGDPPPVPPTEKPGDGGNTPGDGDNPPGDGSDKPGGGDKPGDGGENPGDGSGTGDGNGKGDGTGTGTGPGDGKPDASDQDKKCTEDWCNVGNADGDTGALYKASSDTPASVYAQFKSQVASSPIASAVSGFFAVNVSGACPSWHIPGNAYWGAAGFDFAFFCQPAFLDILTLAGYIVLATAACCATRIAIY